MLIKNEFEVAEPVEKVWQFFENIPQVAACLPGAELTEDLGDEKYKGTVAVRMGPVRLRFAGTADIVVRDEAARRIVVNAAGADEKGRGQASMLVTATLTKSGRGTRVDSHVYAGYTIPPNYDSMIGKLITVGKDRREAIDRMNRALSECMITGVKTTVSFQQAIMQDPNFRRGVYSTGFIDQLLSGARRELIEEKT